ncbi:MAG: sensor histidine kinase [Mangrovibacterium sp.]
MRHPFFRNKLLLLYYAGFWLLVAVANFLLLHFGQQEPIDQALSDSLSSFVIYPLLGTSIWFVIRYNKIDEQDWGKHVVYHLLLATVYNIIWLYLSVGVYKLFQLNAEAQFWQETAKKVLVGYILYGIHVLFFYTQSYYAVLREKTKREHELQMHVREAELSALKSQINPHFLFNSLNSISSLTMSNPEKAQEMVVNLSTFMRYSLQRKPNDLTTLHEEIDNAKLYLDIEKVRFGEKLRVDFQIDENCLQARLPNLILQPVLENAIKYGVYESTSPVTIFVRAQLKGQFLQVSVKNEYDAHAMKNKGEGIGLKNIRQRMSLLYQNPHLLQTNDDGKLFSVLFLFPIVAELAMKQLDTSK